MDEKDVAFMHMALKEAEKAGQKHEVPVGAVIVADSGKLLSAAHNLTIHCGDPTAHAEILAMREAARKVGNYRLLNTTLYVTIEPCIMCMGAIIHARVSRVVFGANDFKWGALGSLYNFADDARFNHQPEITAGVCREEARHLIQAFFRARRNGRADSERTTDSHTKPSEPIYTK